MVIPTKLPRVQLLFSVVTLFPIHGLAALGTVGNAIIGTLTRGNKEIETQESISLLVLLMPSHFLVRCPAP